MVPIRPIPAEATHLLRQRVLRPHQTVAEMVFAGDDDPDTRHFAAFQAGEVVGIASIYRRPPPGSTGGRAWQLRGMVTAPEVRGTGIGGRLLEACFRHIAESGGGLFWCNARLVAVGFYERYGFRKVSEIFELPIVGWHFVMERPVDPITPAV